MTAGPTVGVLSPLAGGAYYGAVVAGIARAVWASGGRVVSLQTQDPDAEVSSLPAPPAQQVAIAKDHIAGYVAMVDAVESDVLAKLHADGIPIVLLSHERDGLTVPSVRPNNASGVHRAVAHLVAHGHTRIGFVGSRRQADLEERYDVFVEALAQHGLDHDPATFYEVDSPAVAGGVEGARRMIDAGLPTTAVIASTDLNALGVVRVLSAAGFDLPADQAIIGFDDQPVSAWMTPALTTIAQRVDELAALAAELLLAQIAGEAVEPRRHELGASPLVVRESCGCTGTETISERVTLGAVGHLKGDDAFEPAAARLATLLGQRIMVDANRVATAPRELAELAGVVTAAIVARLGEAEPTEHSGIASTVWQRLYGLDARQSTILAVVSCVRAVARELSDASSTSAADAVVRLDPLLQDMVLELSRAQMTSLLTENTAVEDLLNQQYALSVDLLRSHVSDPRDLAWLKFTNMRSACFGVWRADNSGELDIVGGYGVGDALLGRRVLVDEFPPGELMQLMEHRSPGDEAAARDVMFVLRVKGARDWGLLAVAGPIESHVATGRETTNQWAALLAVALDHQEVLDSLHEQREDLASAYHRERQLVESIRISEQRYALAAQAANDGLWDWDLTTGSIFLSPRWKAMLGYTDREIGTDPAEWLARVHPDDVRALERAIAAHLGDPAVTLEHEHRLIDCSGDYRWVLCRGLAVRDEHGMAVRLVGSLTDITERRRLEQRLRHDAHYDALTGLPNRTLFLSRLSGALERARQSKHAASAVLWLDLDGFKVVNDSLGHLVGNELLVKVAERLTGFLREGDTAARFGGDEFAVLLEELRDDSDLPGVAGRLQRLLAAPFVLGEHEVVVTASIGIASGLGGYASSDDILRDADIAMYRAKAEGKGTYSVFDSEMHRRALSRLRTENELRQAVDHGELHLRYQPIVRLTTGEQVGVEALIRWQHPLRGLLLPSAFLPIAEESGLVVATGQWVFGEVCRQIQEWCAMAPEGPAPQVSVNLSNKQFWHAGLLDSVDRMLRLTGVDPASLNVEITEGVVMHNPDAASAKLLELAARGLRLHIDDFGTGYSSLEALHRFPIAALKIDQSFVSRLGRRGLDSTSAELLRTIVIMGRNLGMDVIAEGLESADQVARLRDMGCEFGQGLFFSAPVPGPDAWPCAGLALEVSASARPMS